MTSASNFYTRGDKRLQYPSQDTAEAGLLGVLRHMQQVSCVRRVCWSAVNDAVMSGSLLSQEKRLTHGLTGWPTFTGAGKWNNAGHALTPPKKDACQRECRGQVTLQYFARRHANIGQVQTTKVTVKREMTDGYSLW